MKINWLWDSALTESRVSRVLRNEKDPRFFIYAEKLFSRVTDLGMAFKFIPRDIFLRQWPLIKKRVASDAWAREKVNFWESVYRQLADVTPERLAIAEQIRNTRLQLGYTQAQMAKKLGVIQQYVSRLEAGKENLTVDTLKNIADVLGKKLTIEFS